MLNNDIKRNLKTSVSLTFHTQFSMGLIHGSKQNENSYIVGLFAFSAKLKAIYIDKSKDNPFADQFILAALTKYIEAEKVVKEVESFCKKEMENLETLEINLSPAKNKNPQEVSFTFSIPFCYKMAFLISRYDNCIRSLEALEQMTFITDTERYVRIDLMSKSFRSMFHCLEQYKRINIDSTDIALNNKKAKEAIKLMGEPH